ncbi:MAG: DUF2780 domain-containing protein [Glaciecola sp.]|jgi:hypothetical protein|nr:DUF2780 domain-containing protein [Glaciecola sp.]MDG1816598.1 DUF2780 domain-containing protein [Glaciecola sp.]MDG2098864.1 DUF2780 domain-containing protein [Glaciecola sp.]
MKILPIVVVSCTLLCTSFYSSHTHAEGWWDSVKNMLGMGSESAPTQVTDVKQMATDALPSAAGLLSSLTDNLGVSTEQASGGMGAILNYAKQNISSEKFSQLSTAIPGVDSLLSAVPAVATVSEGGLGGLMNKAAEYSDSIKSINDLKNQFDSLGLDSGMVMKYVAQAQQYLDTPQGQEAKTMLTDAFSKWVG